MVDAIMVAVYGYRVHIEEALLFGVSGPEVTSMISIALGFQAGLLIWAAFRQLRDTVWN